MERLYRRAIARNERNVHGTGDRRPFLDPQVSAPVGDEAERPLRALHDSDVEGLQRLLVEGPIQRKLADAQHHVIEQRLDGLRHEPEYRSRIEPDDTAVGECSAVLPARRRLLLRAGGGDNGTRIRTI